MKIWIFEVKMRVVDSNSYLSIQNIPSWPWSSSSNPLLITWILFFDFNLFRAKSFDRLLLLGKISERKFYEITKLKLLLNSFMRKHNEMIAEEFVYLLKKTLQMMIVSTILKISSFSLDFSSSSSMVLSFDLLVACSMST